VASVSMYVLLTRVITDLSPFLFNCYSKRWCYTWRTTSNFDV